MGLGYRRKYSSSILNKTLTELDVDIDLQFCNQRRNIARSAFILLELAKEIQFKNEEQSKENKAYKQNIFHLAKRLHQTILYVDFAVVIWVLQSLSSNVTKARFKKQLSLHVNSSRGQIPAQ